MVNSWMKTSYAGVMDSDSVMVSGIPGYPLGDFLEVVPVPLVIIKGDIDLCDELNDMLIGLNVISFLGENEISGLGDGHRAVLLRDIVAVMDPKIKEKAIELFTSKGLGPSDALNLAPEQFKLRIKNKKVAINV